jgi:ubiquinone biosynthesis protein
MVYAGFRNTMRLMRITQVFLRHDLGEFVAALGLYRGFRFLLFPTMFYRQPTDKLPRGQRLRRALEELGPVFVKFGQMLSTRPDLIPDDIAIELTRLQDDVPPFTGKLARQLIEQAYGEPLTRHFSMFDDKPMASASVAQVHRAQLHDGSRVVVKVLRPEVEKQIDRDLKLLYTLARFAQKYWSEGERLRPVEVVDEYNKTIHDELDLMREASNASKLRSNFENSAIIYVPEIYWQHTRRDVMVMEEVTGIPIRDIEAIRKAGIDMRRLAHNGVEIFFTQAFRDGFFHADMHPGNIFVGPDGQYRAVDFGIMGTLSDRDKLYLAENFLAFFNRDYRGVAEAHLRAGWVPPATHVDEFEGAIRAVCEPIFAKPISEISFARLIVRLFQTARRFNMPIQPQLVLLQKTLFNIEGLGRQLYPDLDLWETAKPYLERWMRDQVGPAAVLRSLRQELPRLVPMIPEIPTIGLELLRQARFRDSPVPAHYEELRQLRLEMRRRHMQLLGTLAGCAVLLAGSISLGVMSTPDIGRTAGALGGGLLMVAGLVMLIIHWPRKPRK